MKVPDKEIQQVNGWMERLLETVNTNKWPVRYRTIIAAIPYIGSPLTVLIDSKRSGLSEYRMANLTSQVDILFSRVFELENAVNKEYEISDELLNEAINNISQRSERWKARVSANILCLLGGSDVDGVLRKAYLDITSQLSTFELVVLISYAGDSLENISPEMERHLGIISHEDVRLNDLKQVALSRLISFHLIVSSKGNSYSITPIGFKFLEQII